MTIHEIIENLEEQIQDRDSLAGGDPDSVFTRDSDAPQEAVNLLRQLTRMEPHAITLTGDEAATLRYLVSKFPWALYIRRFPRCVYLMEGKLGPHAMDIPYELFPILRESVLYEICIDKDGTVRLVEEA